MKYLFVGDPHFEADDLEDAKELAALIWGQAKKHGATVVLIGDLYDTHAIIHAEVQWFWYNFLEDLKEDGVEVIIVKGNHDGPLGSDATALVAHVGQAKIVAWEPFVQDEILFCPYTDSNTLVRWSQEHPECKTMMCHQTFYGARYENGFAVGDGVNPGSIIQAQIISGHIHAPQEFGKVWYPGAPRWRTLSDANTDRAIWLLDFAGGSLVSRLPIETGAVCRRIHHLVVTPAQHVLPDDWKPDAKDQYRVDIRGTREFYEKVRPQYEGWARVRPIFTDSKVEVQVRESDGIDVAFTVYLDKYKPKNGTDKVVLEKMFRERINGF